MKLVNLESFSDKQKLLFFGLVFVILALFAYFLLNLQTSPINYSKVKPSDFVLDYEIENDRKTYWILEEIISSFIASSMIDKTSDENVSYTDYYYALDSHYQEYLGKYKYNKLVNQFFDKFRVNIEGALDGTVKTEGTIQSVYKDSGSNKYICKLNTVTEESFAYIGIELNTNKKTYSIFYIY